MFEYANVPVEIWHQILFAVIDLPYLLDTLVDRTRDYWRTSRKYHAPGVYEASERQRRVLRLVCRSWRAFADENRYRIITYDPRRSADAEEQKAALEAINQVPTSSMEQEGAVDGTSKSRRVAFHVYTDEDMDLFRKMIDHHSGRVTTLFVCTDQRYQNQAFNYLIRQSSRLLNLRCLVISPPNGHPAPFKALSTAFPNLCTFSMWMGQQFEPRDGDILALPHLEILGIDISDIRPSALKTWRLPTLIHLRTAINSRDPETGTQLSLEPIRCLGANLTYLNIYRTSGQFRIPIEFWTMCPRLVELLMFFDWVFINTPVPSGHPLKYVVQWPLYRGSHLPNPTILQSLRCLPPSLELFIVLQDWGDYLEHLAIRSGGSIESERENTLFKMREICEERMIRVEDHRGVALEDFLVGQVS